MLKSLVTAVAICLVEANMFFFGGRVGNEGKDVKPAPQPTKMEQEVTQNSMWIEEEPEEGEIKEIFDPVEFATIQGCKAGGLLVGGAIGLGIAHQALKKEFEKSGKDVNKSAGHQKDEGNQK